ncbi:MAG: hypothetical protein WC989_03495 [Micavibrio sp.]
MSFFSPSRCVLLLNDEGVGVYNTAARKVNVLATIPWDAPAFENDIVAAYKRYANNKPILILNDMVEQHYRKERIPKVSLLDRANVIKRRVAVAFPSYPIRSGIKLKEKPPGRDDKNAAGDTLYLFAASPLSEGVRRVINAVKKTHASVAGFCLLPVESASMVYALSKKLTRAAEKQAKWAIFVGQHVGGGLRQVVTKNGELALTRMTPIVDSDKDPEIWANDVINELRGTMGYLSRFGFEQSEGLDVVVVADNALADRLSSKVDFECNLNIMSAGEAASLLGLKIGRQEEHRLADPLHVMWSGRKAGFTMPLHTAQLESVAMPRRVAAAASVLFVAGACYYTYLSYDQLGDWSKNRDDRVQAQSRLAVIRQEHEEETLKKIATGMDFLVVEKSTRTYARLERDAMKPLPMFEKIGAALGDQVKLKAVDVQSVYAPPQEPSYHPETGELVIPEPEARKFDVVLMLELPSSVAPERGVQIVTDLVLRLQQNLPDHDIAVIKQIADLSYTGNYIGEAITGGGGGQGEEIDDYQAQIRIRGRVI